MHATESLLRKAAGAIFAAITAGGVFLLYAADPSRVAFVPCPFRLFTGLDCPGCGMTRAVHHLLHLDFPATFRFNPFVFAVVPLLAFVWACLFRRILTGKKTLSTIRIHPAVGITVTVVIIAFWILRNLPVPPFSYFKV